MPQRVQGRRHACCTGAGVVAELFNFSFALKREKCMNIANLWRSVGALSLCLLACGGSETISLDEIGAEPGLEGEAVEGAADETALELGSTEQALERMTDRCSAEVAIPASYDARPDSNGTVLLKRDASGGTAWTLPFRVRLGGSGHIRWWCHSTTGNFLDPGTWRIESITAGTKCKMDENGQISCSPDADISIGSSAWQGWTAERSRCDNRSTLVRARLGRDRLLQIECLGR
jgi:hypothetical protein